MARGRCELHKLWGRWCKAYGEKQRLQEVVERMVRWDVNRCLDETLLPWRKLINKFIIILWYNDLLHHTILITGYGHFLLVLLAYRFALVVSSECVSSGTLRTIHDTRYSDVVDGQGVWYHLRQQQVRTCRRIRFTPSCDKVDEHVG